MVLESSEHFRNTYSTIYLQGDSGGPLQTFLPGHKCAFEITGITSFGKMCGTGIPAVYTKVQPYIQWIENVVWP